jgi:hypothetical protein
MLDADAYVFIESTDERSTEAVEHSVRVCQPFHLCCLGHGCIATAFLSVCFIGERCVFTVVGKVKDLSFIVESQTGEAAQVNNVWRFKAWSWIQKF